MKGRGNKVGRGHSPLPTNLSPPLKETNLLGAELGTTMGAEFAASKVNPRASLTD
jgi:hypothetical protein